MSRIAQVLLPLPLPEAFDYAEPEGLDLRPGDLVSVPLGPRTVAGVVTAVKDAAGHNRPLKPVLGLREEPALPAGTLEFIDWAARYAVDSPGQPLAITLRGARAPKPAPTKLLVPTGQAPARMTPARQKVLDAAARETLPAARLAEAAGVSSGVVKGLVDEGCLAVELRTAEPDFPAPDPGRPGTALNDSQAAAADALKAMLDEGGFQAALLDGVTGSGKTEVYLEAAAKVLADDPEAQVLVLLPEIALTQAVIARFHERFGAPPGEWHSAVSPPRRRQVWEGAATGACRVWSSARARPCSCRSSGCA